VIVTGSDVVAQARKYMGVRWAHQGRSPAGMDCAGLVIRVAQDLGLIHALMLSRKVVEHRMDPQWSGRVVAVYALPGVSY